MSFVLLDLETSGLDPQWSVPVQAALLRCNDNLDIVEELELRCRPPAHIVPSPTAMLVTGLTPADLDGANLSHLAMMEEIAAKLTSWSPATMVAYNGLSFDEEHLRHALFATLHPPYLTQRPGNGRADVLIMARAIAALRPDALTLPLPLVNGKPSFKLGPLCRANGIGLSDAAAHDALHDVRATLALMKLLRARAPDLFARLMANARKDVPAALLREEEILVLCSSFGGPIPVAGIMASPTNPSAWLVADLTIDPETYLGLSEAELAALFTAKGRRPFRNVKTNAQPALFRFADAGQALAADAPAEAKMRGRALQIRSDEDFLVRLRTVLAARFADREPSPWPEARLYDGFISRPDEAHMRRWHEIGWDQRYRFASELFGDKRLKAFANRLMLEQAPQHMPEDARRQGEAWLRERLRTKDEVPWLTLPRALTEVAELRPREVGNSDRLAQLDAIEAWLIHRLDVLSDSNSNDMRGRPAAA